MTVPIAPLKQKWHLSGPGGGTVQTKPHGLPAPCRWFKLANCLPQGKLWKEQLLAPGNFATLRALTDPAKRPAFPREELSVEVARVELEEPFQLDAEEFLLCLRKARRGAAAGPSGMTSDHLFPVLENEGDSDLFVRVASLLASGNVPPAIAQAIRLGRMTALSKPDGGVRGIVVGDIIWRLVARSIAKHITKKVEAMTAPFQYALSTKAGCECVSHILQSMTDLDPDLTITSIDGVGAYDLISRNAMLEGFLQMDGWNQIIPFVRMFHGSPSTYLWEDEMGTTQYIPQGEGGEQGDFLMPMLYALGQHGSLVATQERMIGNEKVFAYLDDVYLASGPRRVEQVQSIVSEELHNRAHIEVHHGQTQVWNRSGVLPSGIEALTRAARVVKPDAVVWKGDPNLPPTQQGLKVLGVPLGQPAYVREFLENKSREQTVLFERIPWVNDPQAAWLLLMMCASTRANFWLRAVRPELTEAFASRHDANVWNCLRTILGTPRAPASSQVLSSLALSAGGLGLASAHRTRVGAHWASWADCVLMVKKRHPVLAKTWIHSIAHGDAPCFLAVRISKNWQMQVWRCRLGGNCQILLQSSTRSRSPICPRWGGNRRQPGKLSTSSSVTKCGQGWMILTEL